jgi:hypothetical protein
MVRKTCVALAGLVLLVAGCADKKLPYTAFAQAYGPGIGYVAAYADLVKAGATATAAAYQSRAAGIARSQIAQRAKQPVALPQDAKHAPEPDAAAAKYAALAVACDGPKDQDDSSAADKAVQQCAGALDDLRAALAAADAAATKVGAPAGTIPSLDPDKASDEGKKDAATLRAAVEPSPEEARIAKLWDDPNASDKDLLAACKALALTYKAVGDAGSAGDDIQWKVGLMMMSNPLFALDDGKDPVQRVIFDRRHLPARECVVYTTMDIYLEAADRCASHGCSPVDCILAKGSAADELKSNFEAYAPVSARSRVGKLYDACKSLP